MALYLAAFAVLTFPALAHFSTRFLADGGDGLQNVWNLWWMDRAVRAGENPWFTRALHFPHGTTLVGHTLVPFAGLVGVPLQRVLTLVQTHNAIVVFSFVMGGVTAYWLSLALTGRHAGSLLAGYVFTFSSFHFAHAEGHLQLVSLEWMPLFLLAWWRWLERPSTVRGVGAAAALLLVLLCDYYYFVFSLVAAAVVLGWHVATDAPPGRQALARGLVSFGVAATATCGPLVVALLRHSVRDPLLGAHDPRLYSMDLLAPLIPGGHWRFSAWTAGYWQALPGNIHESSVHWGLSAIVLAAVGWRARGRAGCRDHALLVILLVLFAVLALGPRVQAFGRPLPHIHGPFELLERMFPPLRLAGCPVRMVVMVYLALGILAGVGLETLRAQSRRGRWCAAVLVAVLVFEYWPKSLPETDPAVPPVVTAMATLPRDGAVHDVQRVLPDTAALYYQTVHLLPQTRGYIARRPRSVVQADRALDRLAAVGGWQRLCEEFGVRYLLFAAGRAPGGALAGAVPVLEDAALRVFDVGARWRCGVSG